MRNSMKKFQGFTHFFFQSWYRLQFSITQTRISIEEKNTENNMDEFLYKFHFMFLCFIYKCKEYKKRISLFKNENLLLIHSFRLFTFNYVINICPV